MVNIEKQKIVILAAKRLGYRLPIENADRMVKPFGKCMYILFIKGNEFRLNNYFHSLDGKLTCRDSKVFVESEIDENFEWALSEAEEYLFRHMCIGNRSAYKGLGFLTNKEITESLCGL
jgi:hypothetical protein